MADDSGARDRDPGGIEQVQAKLAQNQQIAPRNNTQHQYLLRALVSCGHCHLGATGRTMPNPQYAYYVCRGHTDALRAAQGERCTARYIPAQPLDDLVWQDLCQVLLDPQCIAQALERAHGGHWLPQELKRAAPSSNRRVPNWNTNRNACWKPIWRR
jgi:site-specific DNA recombinase